MKPERDLDYELTCAEALRLKCSGKTYEQIGVIQECSKSTAYRRCESGLDAMRPHADYDEYRARQLTEIEAMRTSLFSVARDQGHEWSERMDAVDRVVKLHDRESKLLALDKAPTPIEEAARELANASPEEIAAELDRRNAVRG